MVGMQDVVAVEGLRKRYGPIVAVDGVSFTVRRGEVFGILGPNGAGKTTTLEIIEGLRTPEDGRARVLGLDVATQAREVKQRIGVQLQASAYFDYLTLEEVLGLLGRFYRRRLPPRQLLAMVGLQDRARSLVRQLSGGQQQRFSLAAALVNDPEVLFLDEPTTGLDPQARRSLWELIRSVREQGRTVVLTTHYMEEAQQLCDRVAIMDQGRIVALDTPEGLIARLPSPFRIFLETFPPLPEEALKVPGATAVMGGHGLYQVMATDAWAVLPSLLARLGELGSQIRDLRVERATLEDVFLALTGKELRD